MFVWNHLWKSLLELATGIVILTLCVILIHETNVNKLMSSIVRPTCNILFFTCTILLFAGGIVLNTCCLLVCKCGIGAYVLPCDVFMSDHDINM